MNVLNKIKTKQNKNLNDIQVNKDQKISQQCLPKGKITKVYQQNVNKKIQPISGQNVNLISQQEIIHQQKVNNKDQVLPKFSALKGSKSSQKDSKFVQDMQFSNISKTRLDNQKAFKIHFNAESSSKSNQKHLSGQNIFKQKQLKINESFKGFSFQSNQKQKDLSQCVHFKVRRGSQVADMSVFIGHFVQNFNNNIFRQKVDPKLRKQRQIALSVQFNYETKPNKIGSIYLRDFLMIQEDQGIFREENVVKYAET